VLPWWEGADEAQSRCSFSNLIVPARVPAACRNNHDVRSRVYAGHSGSVMAQETQGGQALSELTHPGLDRAPFKSPRCPAARGRGRGDKSELMESKLARVRQFAGEMASRRRFLARSIDSAC
jgi:hypothetical protein